jgi:alpha-tubulin suppressor-like RCC1 family protein
MIPLRTTVTDIACLATLFTGWLTACGGDDITPPPGQEPVAVVVVTPAETTLGVGRGTQFAAVTKAADGAVLTGRTVTWTSDDEAVAAVGSAGTVTAVAPGSATITALSEGTRGTAKITVSAAPPPTTQPVAEVVVSPAALTLPVGRSQELLVETRAADGTVVSGRALAWASNDEAIATVEQSGVVHGVAAGTATITATSEGVAGEAAVTVSDGPPQPVAAVVVSPLADTVVVGQTVQLLAEGRAADGTVLGGRPVSWVSTERGVATVEQSGLVIGTGDGVTRIIATIEGVEGAAEITGLAFRQLSAGSNHTCAVTAAGAAYCWGANYGALGDGTASPSRPRPGPVAGGLIFRSVTAGGFVFEHTCGVTTGDRAYCWGTNIFGSLGIGTEGHSNIPVPVTGDLRFAAVSAGSVGHICGVTTEAAGYCWGFNNKGQLGDGTTTNGQGPVGVAGEIAFTVLSAGGSHSCGGTQDGVVHCWGLNTDGQLGDGTTTDHSTPTPALVPVAFTTVDAGDYHTCALDPTGTAYCWGSNVLSRLGDGTTADRSTPAPVAGNLTFTSVTVGFGHTCGMAAEGATYCWGANAAGQLGDGTAMERNVPVAVAPAPGEAAPLSFTAISAGSVHTCALTAAGAVYCWGANSDGQLGDGTTGERRTPVAVVSPSGPPRRSR